MIDVSIIITAYNYARYIDECLDSCLNQKGTTLNYEVIVVDDGSTDNTPALLAGRHNPRLRVFRIKNSGIELASNIGFKTASGRYIVRVDADDALEPNYLAHMSTIMKQDFDFYYADYTIINENSVAQEIVHLPDFDKAEIMMRGDFLATGTLYSAKLLHFHGGYRTQIKNSGLENYELIIKMITAGAKGIHIAEPLFKYRRHQINTSITQTKKIIAYGHTLFKQNGLGAFRTNQYHPYKLVLPEQIE